MKKVIAIILPLMVLGLFVVYVEAQWNALNSGYAVTTNYHGVDILVGTPVTATAGTTNLLVEAVEFRWIAPDGTVVWKATNNTIVDSGDTWNDDPIYITTNTQAPNVVGDWGVQAIFYGEGFPEQKKIMGQSDIEAIRATSNFTVPEVPFGTIAIVLSVLGALGTYTLRRKLF